MTKTTAEHMRDFNKALREAFDLIAAQYADTCRKVNEAMRPKKGKS